METLQSFFAMGGHGIYIWPAYAITFVVIALNVLYARYDFRAQWRNARRQQQRTAQRQPGHEHKGYSGSVQDNEQNTEQ